MYEIQMALRYSPEFWADVPDYEGLYQVSNLGRVRSLDRKLKKANSKGVQSKPGQILKPWSAGRTGRLKVSLCKEGERAARPTYKLVALVFLGQSNLSVDHINGNYLDNNVVNLRYLTRAENARLGNSILTKEQVKEIKMLLSTTKLSQKAIGKKFGVSREAIKDIKCGYKWEHIK